MALEGFIQKALAELEAEHLRRELRVIDRLEGPFVTIGGRRLLCFCSNDYLGLAPQLPPPRAVGGSGGSRLLCGTYRTHVELEERFARYKRAEAALLFNSAYAANIGLITSICSPETVLLSDQLNHASLIDAARLSRAKVVVYPHNDVDSVRRLLTEHRGWRWKIIVTETFFSMDGDLAPVGELQRLAREFDADLIVDETHATGVLGPTGRGVSEGMNLVEVANLGKAGGWIGGFVVGSRPLRELLISRARTFVYTTSLPPSVCEVGLRAVELLETSDAARAKLWDNIRFFAAGMGRTPAGPVFSIVLGDTNRTLRAGEELWRRGFFAPAIRPPTVPPGTARIRVSLTALHEREHLEALLDALKRL